MSTSRSLRGMWMGSGIVDEMKQEITTCGRDIVRSVNGPVR
jgi:ribosomal protein S28E/S33